MTTYHVVNSNDKRQWTETTDLEEAYKLFKEDPNTYILAISQIDTFKQLEKWRTDVRRT